MKRKNKYYFGIDVGGTFIKGVVTDDNGKIITKTKIPTCCSGGEGLLADISNLRDALLTFSEINPKEISAAGIGITGLIDSVNGTVITSEVLGLMNFNLGKEAQQLLGMPVKIANDANTATLGEMRFGFKGEYRNVVMLTLGTGVGGGIVTDGKLYEGNMGAGAEIGHTVIAMNGKPCSCGRRGCLEAYASATALIRDTKTAMLNNKDSKLWEIDSIDAVNGKTAFDYCNTDEYARGVIDSYIEHLACGITNIANIFRPEAVILGGGVCAQGEALTKPLQEILDKDIFAGKLGPSVKILTARLGNDAGALGAAALVMKKS